MRTIGEVLKEARVRKKYSRVKLENKTKIKKDFIEAIEKENWEVLPEYPVVAGFVRSIADVLKIDRKQTLAKLRRDYPPKKLRINPKPDVSDKFTWSPKLTFLTGVVVVSLLVLSYLGLQYRGFITPPPLTVEKPKEGEIITQRQLEVMGATDPEAIVRVNNQPILVEESGEFTAKIEIYGGTYEIEIKAISRSGKESVIRRKIIPELE